MSSQPHRCPICEHQFPLAENAQWFVCPSCGHRQSSAVFPDDDDFLGALVDLGEETQTLIDTDDHDSPSEFGDQTAVVALDQLESPAMPPRGSQAIAADLPPAPLGHDLAATGIDLPETPQGEDIDMDFFEPGTGLSNEFFPSEPADLDPQTLTRPVHPRELPTKKAPRLPPKLPPKLPAGVDTPRPASRETRATPIAAGATVLPNLGSPSFLGPMVPDLSVPVASTHSPPPLPADLAGPANAGGRALAKIALKSGTPKRPVANVDNDLPSLEDYESQSVYDLPPPGPPSILNDSGVSVYVPDAPVIEHRNDNQPFFQGQREKRARRNSQIPLLQPVKVRRPSTSISALKPGIRVRGSRTWLIVLGAAMLLAGLAVGIIIALKP